MLTECFVCADCLFLHNTAMHSAAGEPILSIDRKFLKLIAPSRVQQYTAAELSCDSSHDCDLSYGSQQPAASSCLLTANLEHIGHALTASSCVQQYTAAEGVQCFARRKRTHLVLIGDSQMRSFYNTWLDYLLGQLPRGKASRAQFRGKAGQVNLYTDLYLWWVPHFT